MGEFYNEIIENLKQEAKNLNKRLEFCRSKNNMQDYIVILKSLKETLNLISIYDWQLKYSEYGVENENNKLITEIAI